MSGYHLTQPWENSEDLKPALRFSITYFITQKYDRNDALDLIHYILNELEEDDYSFLRSLDNFQEFISELELIFLDDELESENIEY